jgi:hypothetical protein
MRRREAIKPSPALSRSRRWLQPAPRRATAAAVLTPRAPRAGDQPPPLLPPVVFARPRDVAGLSRAPLRAHACGGSSWRRSSTLRRRT